MKVTKSDVDLELELLEQAAELAVEEQEESANQVTDSMAAMTVAPEPGPSSPRCQRETGLTDDDKLARLAEELQINSSRDVTEEAASCEGNETIGKVHENQEKPKCEGNGHHVGKCREGVLESPEDNDCSRDIVQNTKVSSDAKKGPIGLCAADSAKRSSGSRTDTSHDALGSQDRGSNVDESELGCECSASQHRDDRESGDSTCSETAAGDRPVCQQDAAGDRPVCQQDAAGDRPVCQQDAAGDRPVCQQDATGDRPVCQQDAAGDRPVCQQGATGDRPVCQQDAAGDRPVCQQGATGDIPICQQDAAGDRSVCQQDPPRTQIKDGASLNF